MAELCVSPALPHLLQLVSPALPTGAFSYSQGLEWAVEAGWIQNGDGLSQWLRECLHTSICRVDLPILKRLFGACLAHDNKQLRNWIDILLACRESGELHAEEMNRGRAMRSLLQGLDLVPSWLDISLIEKSQLAGFALLATLWKIELEPASTGYIWAWLENQVTAGVKIIPLGQTAGQQLLFALSSDIADVVKKGLGFDDEDIGASSAGLALASCFHEKQYTRIYRS